MLENAIYSVITPEGCAAILWKDAAYAADAASGLRLTAEELLHEGIVDKVVLEPSGGAHAQQDKAATLLDAVLQKALAEVLSYSPGQRLSARYQKLRGFGKWGVLPTPTTSFIKRER